MRVSAWETIYTTLARECQPAVVLVAVLVGSSEVSGTKRWGELAVADGAVVDIRENEVHHV